MKKVTAIIMATAVAFVFSAQAWSQNTGTVNEKDQTTKSTQQAKPAQGNFVDKNKNGVCDNFESRGSGSHGKNYVDKNGDGKCDNCKGNCKGNEKGNCCGKCPGYGKDGGKGCCGYGQGHRHRHGCQGTNQETAKPATDTQEKK